MDDDSIVKQGWLRKSPPPGVMKAWKKRYFVFKRKTSHGAARLEYYAETNKAARGVIDLRACVSVEETTHEPDKARFNFRIVTQHRTYTLQAATKEDMKEWIKALCDEVFKVEETQSQQATLQRKPPPAMAARANLPVPTQEAPRRTSISVKQQPSVPKGRRQKPYHPRPTGDCPWLYGKISRQATEGLLADYGLQDGLFLVRESASHAGSYAISVCYMGKVVHHLVRTLSTGIFQVNEHECPDCTSLEEVIDYLETPKETPFLWRYHLKICPATYDEKQSQSNDGRPPSAIPPLPPRTEEQSSGDGRTFPVTIAAVQSKMLSLSAGLQCHLHIASRKIELLNEDSSIQHCSWPASSIFDFGIDRTQDTFYLKSNFDVCGGTFHFKSSMSFDMMALLRQQISDTSKVSSSNSIRTKPAVAKKPSRLSTRAPESRPKMIAPNSDDYSEPVDAVPSPDLSKPMPPPIGTNSKVISRQSAFNDNNLKESLNNVVQGQVHTFQTGKPAVALRRPQSHVDDTQLSKDSSKRTSVADIGVAIPGVDGMDISKALSGLKKTSPHTGQLKKIQGSFTEEDEGADVAPAQRPPPPPPFVDTSSQRNDNNAQLPGPAPSQKAAGEILEEYIAGCDFDPGPNAPDRLPFEEGQVVVILKKPNANWWLGRLGDAEGWVPASFMDPIDDAAGNLETAAPTEEEDPVAKALAAVQNADKTLHRLNSRAGMASQ